MTTENSNQPFKAFCADLEELKGRVPLYVPSEEWTEKVLALIRKDAGN